MTPADPLLDRLRTMPDATSRLSFDLSNGDLGRAPCAGGFSLVEHACHLRDYEGACLERILRMLVEHSPRLDDFDGEAIAAARDYIGQNFAAALGDFTSRRQTTIEILTMLTPEQLLRDAVLGDRGRVSVRQLAELIAAHDATHLREIEALVEELRSDSAEDVAAIRQIADEFTEGFNSGDVDRMMRFYGEKYVDVNLRQPIQSHSQRRAYYATLMRHGTFRLRVQPDEIVVHGAVAFGRGRIELIDRRTAATTELRYLEVLHKQPDGWKAVWGIDGPVQEYTPATAVE